MLKNILISLIGLIVGVAGMMFLLKGTTKLPQQSTKILNEFGILKTSIIGFLPYWLITDDTKNSLNYLNEISYFGITLGPDGKIVQYTDENDTESEPGWFALKSGKMDAIFDTANKSNLSKSLVIFGGDQEDINQLIGNPVEHAKNVVDEISPILTKYQFTDLNIDIEKNTVASESARQNFTLFTKTIHDQLKKTNSNVKLSIDVSPIVLFKPYLVDVVTISPYIDKIIFMDYDFHFQGSSVSGPVSPVNGGGVSAEFDTEVSVKKALTILPPEKIILAVPLYGYEWETLSDHPHAGVIPGSGITASNERVEKLLAECATCSAQFDPISQESYLIYKDQETNTYHQIFYPDKRAMEEKIKLIKKYHLSGIAVWALGYEGKNILEPLKQL